ncbi:hypothetical protein CFC21_057371 [Triticum aestivum]|uniref:Uncharacterized protein n=3 Tax=Triticum TaxID=4564 RepID=A0A9R0T0J6_TRITD|nr:hypothetical protein CFC21_057371 [Triticum aestivum]VAI04914.1 unnamed protein product [Triticum turgidum subsp. durum]
MAMGTRRAALCFLLLVSIFLQGNPTLVSADEECKYRIPYVPFCKGWSCKVECWLEAKLFRARLQEHKCIRGGIKGACYCLFCGKHLQ